MQPLQPRSPPFAPALARVLICAACLALGACASSGHEYVRSITYSYSNRDRVAAERRVSQQMQDACYFSGAQYYESAGPPVILSRGKDATGPFEATQSFYCVGTAGGP